MTAGVGRPGPLTLAVTDSATMLRRQLRHLVRYPSLTLLIIGMPVVFLLLFVFVFGGTLGAGLGAVPAGGDPRGAYATFLLPGILVMTVASAAQSTAISVATDMTGGIVARFRTMAVARVSVLTGHVLGALVQTALGLVVVTGVAFAVGFRPVAGGDGWAGVLGLLVLVTVAMTWLSVAFGLVSDSVETASNLPMFLTLLPFLGSGFVPTASMPAGLRWFAELQPMTPVIDTLRGLLGGAPIGGGTAAAAVAWWVAIGLGGHAWARRLYERRAG